MKSTKPLSTALAVALALGVAACDGQPGADKSGKTFDKLVENASRDLQSAPDPAPLSGAGEVEPRSSGPAMDSALEARVKAALSADPELRAVTIDVKSSDGVVTLYGTADSSTKSHHAAMAALAVDGVRSVRNEMVIVRGS